jgi:hypothetical protein
LRLRILCRSVVVIELRGMSPRVGVWVAWRDGLRSLFPGLVFFRTRWVNLRAVPSRKVSASYGLSLVPRVHSGHVLACGSIDLLRSFASTDKAALFQSLVEANGPAII